MNGSGAAPASKSPAPRLDRGKPLTKRDYESLTKRWITLELADVACLRRVDDQEAAVILARKGSGNYAGILIPYFLPGKDYPHTYRIRRDHPETEHAKPKNKYSGPPGENRIYFPPGTDSKWLAETGIPLVIAEGEFKTLALSRLAQHNLGDAAERPRFLALGIGGVWNWRGKTGISVDQTGTRVPDKGAIADLGLVKYKARDTIILFDADLESNQEVLRARAGLTECLWSLGARVKWFVWPKKLPAGVKGIDDYLYALGPESALKLIELAIPARESVRVWSWPELRGANFPPPVAIAEDFLYEGETIAVVGKPKQGKSRLVQEFAINASRGEPFIGHAMTKEWRVLILDLENRPAATRNRLLKLSDCGLITQNHQGTEPLDENLFLYIPESLMGNRLTLMDKKGPKLLERAVEDCSPDILIIDNWRLFLAGDENNHEVIVRGLKIISGLRSIAPKLAVVIVHHTRKQQQGENQPRLRVDPSGWVEGASGHYAFIGH
jgi:hypothetical protein